ncbi:tripartite tricarboxylate transporter substrate binding protein [Ideonella sp. A 288]|uniref:Bug family tripartite tricarboxylate transporter substrate binding protein n=1 Tax=Ideonella sp. A 288 TaxID=1962181 RepID=UPI000B4B30B9|nr:tripartite tricarboxylate transporter substrate binding protein [Ideonella sp. A 288]
MAHPSRTILSRLLAASALAAAVLAGPAALAQGAYPNRAITVVAPYSAGGDADLAARNFAAAAQRVLGQTVLVVNKTGASGVIGSAQVVAAPPDGYTLLLARTGSQAILPAIQPTSTKYKWDDYTFIGMLELNPYGCAVNAKSTYRTLDDLVKAIRSKGKSMNFGTAGQLTTNDMGPRELFRLLKLTPDQAPTMIPYKGTGDAVQSLLAGETDFSCGSMGPFLAHIKAGTLRTVMVTTAERLASLPDVPTARELGYAEMERIVGWSAVFGPAKLPADVRDKLTATLKALATDPAWLAGTAQTGSVPYVKSPDETRDFVQGQYQLYRTLGEQLGIIDGKP